MFHFNVSYIISEMDFHSKDEIYNDLPAFFCGLHLGPTHVALSVSLLCQW